jgi:hypothetical protein
MDGNSMQITSTYLLPKKDNHKFTNLQISLPLLPIASSGVTNLFPPESNVLDFGSNSSIRLIVENLTPIAHPMHLHGHNFWVLASGLGTWDGKVQNPTNPPRRDVKLIAPASIPSSLSGSTPSYLVIEFNADNPGVWPFHCHIAWHVSAGLYVNILEREKDIKSTGLQAIIDQTCKPWDTFSNSHVVDEIDSGLKLKLKL